jgi:hypothetical protein
LYNLIENRWLVCLVYYPHMRTWYKTHTHTHTHTHTKEANGTTTETLTLGSAVADRRKMRRNSPNSQVFYL